MTTRWWMLVALGLSMVGCGEDEGCEAVASCALAGTHWDRKACDCVPDDGVVRACEKERPPADAGLIPCTRSRAYLDCGDCTCSSSDGTSCGRCPGPCKNLCKGSEYASACGGPLERDYEGAEQSCRTVVLLRGGITASCCPCD